MIRVGYKKLLFALVFLMLTSLYGIGVVNAKVTRDYTDKLGINLHDASYGDFDNDGRADDIQAFLDIIHKVDKNNKHYRILITLITPDNQKYQYEIAVLVSSIEVLCFRLVFYNHAKVAGDYTITAEIIYFVPGLYYSTTTIVFDPPSEKIPDSEPPSLEVTLC